MLRSYMAEGSLTSFSYEPVTQDELQDPDYESDSQLKRRAKM